MQFRVVFRAFLGIEQASASFGEEVGRFIEPLAQQLRHRVARLVFEREFFLPPDVEKPRIFLNEIGANVACVIEAQALVKVWRIVTPPSFPSEWIVWYRIWKSQVRGLMRAFARYEI